LNKIKKIANNLITPGGTLSQRVVKGGFWVFFLRIVNRGFSLIRLIILARILAPSDFGLMGIALLTMSTLETFSQTGFQTALIQKKEDIKSYLNSAWTVLILRGFILFIILYFIAPYAAIFFDAPEAKPIFQVIGFTVLFRAFTNIGVIYFQKELEFNREFIYQFSGTIADFIVAISAVLILKNVWALVLGLLAGNIVRCFVSYLIHPYRPRLNFDLEKIKELFGFGKWIMGSSILIFLLTQGDDIFVGKLLGTTALGFYQMAYRISNMPATEITHVISKITFPAYSKLQDNIPKLREAYLKVLQITAFLSFPIAGLIFILAPDFTRIFLGEKWVPMAPAMQVLCVFGATRSIAATVGPVLYATGNPKIETKIATVQLLLLAILLYPLSAKYGIKGTAWAIVIPNFVSLLLSTFRVKGILKITAARLFKIITPIVVATSPMFLLLYLKDVGNINATIQEIVTLAFIGISSYIIAIYLLDIIFKSGLWLTSVRFIKEL